MSDPKGSLRRPEWQNFSCRLYRYWIPFYRIKVPAVWVVVRFCLFVYMSVASRSLH
jgi:hypothetical protein